MTQRYAGFLASTQQNIADRSQSVMDEMLEGGGLLIGELGFVLLVPLCSEIKTCGCFCSYNIASFKS